MGAGPENAEPFLPLTPSTMAEDISSNKSFRLLIVLLLWLYEGQCNYRAAYSADTPRQRVVGEGIATVLLVDLFHHLFTQSAILGN